MKKESFSPRPDALAGLSFKNKKKIRSLVEIKKIGEQGTVWTS